MDQKVLETAGTLDLKIAQLKRRLKILEQCQAMSQAYPTYQAQLAQENLQLQAQLRQLIQCCIESSGEYEF